LHFFFRARNKKNNNKKRQEFLHKKRIGPGMNDHEKIPGLLRTTSKYTKEDLFFHNKEDIWKTSG